MDFFDPEGSSFLRPEIFVQALAFGGFQEKALAVEEKVLILLTDPDLKRARRLTGAKGQIAWWPYRKVYRSKGLTIARCSMGAPNVVAMAEELFAFGGRTFVLFGYCGALDEGMEPGDVLLPTEALREEGTSYHYLPAGRPALASVELLEGIFHALKAKGLQPRKGKVWTTDALYRETEDKISRYRSMGYLAVEMECSALYSWATFRGAKASAVLVVSDGFSPHGWRPFFNHPSFVMGRRRALKALVEALTGDAER